jgi:hypothetical protein
LCASLCSDCANELTNSAKEESNKEERQVPLAVANIQTDSLCADEHRSRGESSDCQRATFSQMSVGSHVDCYHCTTPKAMEQGRDRSLCSMWVNFANELTRSADEEFIKEERQVLSVANKHTKSLCADEHRSRGESSDCQRATFSQLSDGSHVACDHRTTPRAMEQGRDRSCYDDQACVSIRNVNTQTDSFCDDERWSRGESLCDNDRCSMGESSGCPGVNSVGQYTDRDSTGDGAFVITLSYVIRHL